MLVLKEKGLVFGLNSLELLGIYDLDTQSLKTSQCSLLGEEQELLQTLPKSGWMQNGKLFRLPKWEPGILEKESGLWPTPKVSDTEGGIVKNVELRNGKFSRTNKAGVRWGVKLKDAINHVEEKKTFWPTPTVGCVEGGEQSNRVEKTKKGSYILRKKGKSHMTYGAKLSDAVLFQAKQETFPTPIAGDWKGQVRSKGEPGMLSGVVEKEAKEKFPTPTVQDGENDGAPSQYKRHSIPLNAIVKDSPQTTGQLNPMWVEWLMGYPIGWTDLKDWETQ